MSLPSNDDLIQSYVAKMEKRQLREGLIFVKGDENLVMAQIELLCIHLSN